LRDHYRQEHQPPERCSLDGLRPLAQLVERQAHVKKVQSLRRAHLRGQERQDTGSQTRRGDASC